MLVIKKRSKLVKSLSAGVVMFAVGLTGSVAYLDAMTPSGFASEAGKTPLTKTGNAAGEVVASQVATSEQPSTDATSSSSGQPAAAMVFAPAPTESSSVITAQTPATAVEQTTPLLESAPSTTAPEPAPAQEPSLLEGVILPLLP